MRSAPKQEHCIPRQPKEVLNPPTILIHKNLILFVLLIILIALLTYTVIKLYQSEKITFPFRNRNESEEIREEPLEDLEPGDEYFDEPDILETTPDVNEEFETRVSKTEEELFTSAEIEEEIYSCYTTDCNDYLSEYMILSTNFSIPTEDNLFARYIRPF
jgi:hypothetical protein